MKNLRNLVLTFVVGAMILAQSVMPVSAAEALPMVIERCPKCREALHIDVIEEKKREEGPLYRCSEAEHQSINCWIFKAYYFVSVRYVCPSCDYSRDNDTYYEWREIHKGYE